MPLTFAANTFVNEALLPRLAIETDVALRAFSLTRASMATYAERGLLDAAVTVGFELALPLGWSIRRAGSLAHGLFAAPAVARALGEQPSWAAIRALPFVTPVEFSRDGVVLEGDDRCPIPRSERVIRHEVESMRLACIVAAASDALVFGPVVAAAPLVGAGRLVAVDASGFTVVEPLYLAYRDAAVSSADRDALTTALDALFPPNGAERPSVTFARSGIVPIIDDTSDSAAELNQDLTVAVVTRTRTWRA